MKICISYIGATAAAVLLFLTFLKRAQAYIDPGTGSYLYQIILAVFTVAVLFCGQQANA